MKNSSILFALTIAVFASFANAETPAAIKKLYSVQITCQDYYTGKTDSLIPVPKTNELYDKMTASIFLGNKYIKATEKTVITFNNDLLQIEDITPYADNRIYIDFTTGEGHSRELQYYNNGQSSRLVHQGLFSHCRIEAIPSNRF